MSGTRTSTDDVIRWLRATGSTTADSRVVLLLVTCILKSLRARHLVRRTEQFGANRSKSEQFGAQSGSQVGPKNLDEGQAGYRMVRGDLHGPGNIGSCLSMSLIADRTVKCGCAVYLGSLTFPILSSI